MTRENVQYVLEMIDKLSADTGLKFGFDIQETSERDAPTFFAQSDENIFVVSFDYNSPDEEVDLCITEKIMDDGFSTKTTTTNYFWQSYDFVLQKIKEKK